MMTARGHAVCLLLASSLGWGGVVAAAPPIGARLAREIAPPPETVETSVAASKAETTGQPFSRALDSLTDRMVRSFDFDEPDNPTPVPLYWVRISGDQYPTWNTPRFDPEDPAPGATDRAIVVPVSGGNAGIRLTAGVVPAIPGIDYHIRVRVRTEGLRWARARLAAWFADESGAAIAKTVTLSEPLVTDGQWQWLDITLNNKHLTTASSIGQWGVDEKGLPQFPAWIQIELRVEQPRSWMERERFTQDVRFQDVVGSAAYFDDLHLWRIPRIEITTTPTGLYGDGESVEIGVRGFDIATSSLAISAQCVDMAGTIIDSYESRLSNDGQPVVLRPKLPAYGWYRLIVQVSERGNVIDRRSRDFAYLSPMISGVDPNGRFAGFGVVHGFDAQDEPEAVTQLCDRLGTTIAWLPMWSRQLTLKSLRWARERLQVTVSALSDEEREVGFFVPEFPDALSSSTDGEGVTLFDAAGGGGELTWRFLEEYLIGFGQRVTMWQFGPMDSIATAEHGRIAGLANQLLNRVTMFVPAPRLMLPWSVEYAAGAKQMRRATSLQQARSTTQAGTHFIVRLDTEIGPEYLGDHVRAWGADAGEEIFLIETLDEQTYGLENRVNDLARRTIYAWEGGARRLLIDQPWRTPDEADGHFEPTQDYTVWRTLGMHLAGREAAARLDLGQDVVAIVLRDIDGTDGTIAIWHDSPTVETMRVSVFLGSRTLQKTDLQGNVEPIPVVDGVHELTIGRNPVFLDEADINLALFRSGFSVDPPFIEGATARHLHHFVLTNPWPTAIAGTMRIIEPANWEIQERIRRLLIATGQEIRLPIVFNYPAFETAGPKRFVVDITLDSSSATTVRMEAIAELGLEKVRLVPQMSLETMPDGTTELVITHSITNRSEEPVWLTAFTVAEGFGRQEYDVARLSPGESTLRVFRISDPWKTLRTPMIRIGLRERGGSKQINMLLDTNPLREEDGQPRLPMAPVE